MNLMEIQLFKGSIFKQIKFLLSSPQQAQHLHYIAESGNASHEILPISTGFAMPLQTKKAWQVIHNLKLRVLKDGVPVQDESGLLVSDRSHIPLDPLNMLSEQERKEFAYLDDIAKLRHAEARADTRGYDTKRNIAEVIIIASFVIMGLAIMMTLIKGC